MNQPDANLSGGYSQNGVSLRDNSLRDTDNIVVSYGHDKMADGEVDWAAMAAEAMKGK